LDKKARVAKELNEMSKQDMLVLKEQKYHRAWVDGGKKVNQLGHPAL